MKACILSVMVSSFVVLGSCSEPSIDPEQALSHKLPDDITFNQLRTGGDGYRALLLAYRATTKFSSSNVIQQDVTQVLLENPDSAHTVFGGNVSINGTGIRILQLPEGSTTYQSIQHNVFPPLQIVPLNFNGSYQVFRVNGNSNFPAFTDSLQSPTTTVDITAPAVDDTVSKSSGFRVQWTGISGHDLSYITISGNGSQGFGKKVTGQNSITIYPSDIAGLNPGRMSISITSGNYKGLISDDIGRIVAVYSSMAIETHLAP